MSKGRERFRRVAEGVLGLLIWGLIFWGLWTLGTWGWPRLRDGAGTLWRSAVQRTPPPDPLPAEAARKLEAGLAAAAEGKWSEAASQFEAARRLVPEDPEILFQQATAEYHMPGRMVRSFVLYQAYLALAPDARHAPMARERGQELERRWDAFQRRLLTGMMKANERLGPAHTAFNYEWGLLAQASAQLGFSDIARECLQQRTDGKGFESREVLRGLVRAGKAAEAEKWLGTAAPDGLSGVGRVSGNELQFEELACAAVARGEFEAAKKWSAKITDPTSGQRLAEQINRAASDLLTRQLYANNLTSAIRTVAAMGEGPERIAAQRKLAKDFVWELEHVHHAKDAATWKGSLETTPDGDMNAVYGKLLSAWSDAVKEAGTSDSIKDKVLKAIRPAGPPKDSNGLPVSEQRKRLAKLWLRELNEALKEPVFTDLAGQLKSAAQSSDSGEIYSFLYKLTRWTTGKAWVQQHMMWFGEQPAHKSP